MYNFGQYICHCNEWIGRVSNIQRLGGVGVGRLLSIVERQFMIFSSFRLSGVPFLVEDD